MYWEGTKWATIPLLPDNVDKRLRPFGWPKRVTTGSNWGPKLENDNLKVDHGTEFGGLMGGSMDGGE